VHLNRRTLLRWALAQSLAGASLASWARTAERVTFESNPFRLGVASGDPTSRSVVLWTRLMPVNPLRNPWEDRNVHVEWQLAPDPSFTAGVQRGETWAPPELAHSVHAEIEGLQPNQVYWYRFVRSGARAPCRRPTMPHPP
jgi:alkaline phosphatase D